MGDLCVIILNQDQQIRCCVNFSIFSSGGHCSAEPFLDNFDYGPYEEYLDEIISNLGPWPSGLGRDEDRQRTKIDHNRKSCLHW